MKSNKIVVDISVRQEEAGSKHRILVDVTFKNSGPMDQRLEKWLALDPPVVTLALLRISKADGSPVRYNGRHINRHPPAVGDLVVIPSAQSRLVKDVDVTAMYDWPTTPQKLTIKYGAFSAVHSELELVQSPSRELPYVPVAR